MIERTFTLAQSMAWEFARFTRLVAPLFELDLFRPEGRFHAKLVCRFAPPARRQW